MIETIIETLVSGRDLTEPICQFIIAFAIITFLWFNFRNNRIFSALELFIKEINELSDNSPKENIKLLSNANALQKSHIIKNLWERYSKALLRGKDERTVIDISNFFNWGNLIEVPGSRKIAEAIPGILTAIGILGTFIGLVSGLGKVDIGSSESIRQSLEPLLKGLGIAFYSSVVGVSCSIAWTFFDRVSLHSKTNVIVQFHDSFREKFHINATRDYLEEIVIHQSEQTESIKQMSTDISLELSKQLRESIEEHMTPQINKTFEKAIKDYINPSINATKEIVEELSAFVSQNQSEGLKAIVDEFVRSMNHSLQGQFENLGITIDEICKWQRQTKEDLQELIHEIKESVLNQKEINISAEEIIRNISGYFSDIHEANKDLSSNIKVIKELSDVIRIQAEDNYKSFELIKSERNEIDIKYNEIGDKISVKFNELINIWEETSLMLKELNNNLQSSMKEFVKSTHQGLRETFNKFDKELATITSHLSGTIRQVHETIDELPNAIVSFKQSLLIEHERDNKEK